MKGYGEVNMTTGYIVLEFDSIQDLTDRVNDFIRKGFEPLGGITYDGSSYIQAMTTERPDDMPISQEFKIVEKGIVPGKQGPEYHIIYEYKGQRKALNLGQGLRN